MQACDYRIFPMSKCNMDREMDKQAYFWIGLRKNFDISKILSKRLKLLRRCGVFPSFCIFQCVTIFDKDQKHHRLVVFAID